MDNFLPIANERRTSTKGSNSQSRPDTIAVHNGAGQFLPIVWDNLDYIYCGEPHTHPVIISYDDQLDYQYPVGRCTYFADKIITHDAKGEEIRQLQEWFGAGFIRVYNDKLQIINDDESSFGTRDAETLQIGLHYTVANDELSEE